MTLLSPISMTFMTIISGSTLTAQGFEGSSPRRLPTPNETHAGKVSVSDRCRDAFFQYALPLKKIAKFIPAAKDANKDAIKDATDVLDLDADDCVDPKRRTALVKILSKLLNEHERTALLIVPADGVNNNNNNNNNADRKLASDALERGIVSAIGPDLAKSLRTIHVAMTPGGKAIAVDDLLKAIAVDFWTTKPSLIFSAMPPSEDHLATALAMNLAIPVVLVGPASIEGDATKKLKSRRIFRIFPDQTHLAVTLAKGACARGLKKTGILRPATPEAGSFAKHFEAAFTACGGLVASGGNYITANFEAVDQAIKELALGLRTKQATTSHPAGLLILDDARVARHAAKVAKLNGLTNLTLMGHHRWRSATIIQPFDPDFEKAFFVDYLGLNQSSAGSLPEFPEPQATWQATWLATGRRAGQLASATFQAGSGYPRKNLHRIMAALPSPQDDFFQSRTFFGPNLNAWWPAFVFTISQGTLIGKPSIASGEPALDSKPREVRAIPATR